MWDAGVGFTGYITLPTLDRNFYIGKKNVKQIPNLSHSKLEIAKIFSLGFVEYCDER